MTVALLPTLRHSVGITENFNTEVMGCKVEEVYLTS
jgi:hypothetical protein